MSNTKQSFPGDPTSLRRQALSRWDNEGGAIANEPRQVPQKDWEGREAPPLTDAELVLLRVRVIALENLVIALLAGGSDRQNYLARQMAAQIIPKVGYFPHPLTVKASVHMTNLIDRAAKLNNLPVLAVTTVFGN